ncbi:AAA family ATPase [Vibrio superstes]|uniref:Cell division protein ZipA n=1 Tax=Vibrio superstes NBRC 103154 TaxID=1219062 RepID=A0A511QW04_9VIBR|nr:ATP-binding protein [Vibrio superstes]GEM81548.1 cell division protein ZipA [Vibrio superstes NBRC 103154]
MAQLYFISGFIGSGKTTYSKELAEKTNGFRFSIDEWMIPLFGEHMERDVLNQRLRTLESLFQDASSQLVRLGVPVVFDFGYWSRDDRARIVSWASEQGYSCEMHYLDVSFDTCCQRAFERNANTRGKSYEMTPEMLELFWSWFEVPTQDEDVIWVSN